MAHDFNNILTAITGYGSLLSGRLTREGPPDRRRRRDPEGGRARGAADPQLLAFSRRQVLALQRVSLGALVGDMQRMLERIIGEDVVLVAELDHSAPRVHVDPGQLQQVILNLAVNARDAMPTGGR